MSLVEEAINGLNESIWVASTKPLEFLFCSENTARLSGRSPDEFYNGKVFLTDLIHPNDQGRFLNEVLICLYPHKIKHREIHKDGHIINVETEGYKAKHTHNDKPLYYGITRKI